MEEIKKEKVAASPQLWGMLGVLYSNILSIVTTILCKIGETCLLYLKASVSILKFYLFFSELFPIGVFIAVIILIIKKNNIKQVPYVRTIVFLCVWPLLALINYYLSALNGSVLTRFLPMQQISELNQYIPLINFGGYMANILSIAITVAYLLIKKRK